MVQGSPDGNIRYADPPNSRIPAIPAGRQGHSLSTVEGKIYMFGGRTGGYSCAYSYIDQLNLGIEESGREIYPCSRYHAESHELWSLDASTYEWVYITSSNATHFNITPPAREQHTASIG
jgi:hypothetical protein